MIIIDDRDPGCDPSYDPEDWDDVTGDGDVKITNFSWASNEFDVQWTYSKNIAAGTELAVSIETVDGGFVGDVDYTVGSTGIVAGSTMGLKVSAPASSTPAGTYVIDITVGDDTETFTLALLG